MQFSLKSQNFATKNFNKTTVQGCKPIQIRSKNRLIVKAVAVPEAPAKVDADLQEKCINAIRFLSIDAVNKAKSGHPGCPMGTAPLTYSLFKEYMKYNPKNPLWINRDRFILSAGHASMLIYSLLYLTGYETPTLDDIKGFRQYGSHTPGHPENFETAGIEVTTGPLGQGVANAVGIAMAEKHLGAMFNKPDVPPLVDHYTYVLMGDGCAMEGISNEAGSLAGHLGLGKLIVYYDDNKISIDGDTALAFTEDVNARYAALGWHVQEVKEATTDLDALRRATEEAQRVTDKPSFIKVKTVIGYGSPNKAGKESSHGSALGEEERKLTSENLKWPYEPFEVPEDAFKHWRNAIERGQAWEDAYNKDVEVYKQKYPKEYEDYYKIANRIIPEGWEKVLPTYPDDDKPMATRQYSQIMLNAIAEVLPGLFGGSADLTHSNLTQLKAYGDFQKDTPKEKNIKFGVREHAMAAAANGIALYGTALVPYVATFLCFTDYMRGAMRLSALSRAPVIYVTTHDSIGLGEDGPTHQPIEHAASFRAMPNMYFFRPCGGNETNGSYQFAVNNSGGPTLLAFSRQGMRNCPGLCKDKSQKGAYTVQQFGGDGTPDIIYIGTGTEFPLAYEAAERTANELGKKARAVSAPCLDLFDEQSQSYRDEILPPEVQNRVSVEAYSSYGWTKYIGFKGIHIGRDDWGASGNAADVYKGLNITADATFEAGKKLLSS